MLITFKRVSERDAPEVKETRSQKEDLPVAKLTYNSRLPNTFLRNCLCTFFRENIDSFLLGEYFQINLHNQSSIHTFTLIQYSREQFDR